jgi:glycosyltransferase involved in cell wall biosynthesis
MRNTVTVAVPVYKRLDYLPQALRSLNAQDYPLIELIVSDNGLNGTTVPEIVRQNYDKPFRFRENSSVVSMATHFNQVLSEATGEYFMVLCDDDEVSPNYVAEMVELLDAHPDASVGVSRLEVMDERGASVRRSDELGFPPSLLSGEDFVHSWCTGMYDFVCFVTNLARTDLVRRLGGYPDFPTGNSIDNAVMVKLCVGNNVCFTRECLFRYRVYEASEGLSASYQGLARALRGFMRFLETDPWIVTFAQEQPGTWSRMKGDLMRMTWRTYHSRWASMYRERLGTWTWIKAGFVMPFIPAYYRRVLATLRRSFRQGAAREAPGRAGADS